MDVAAACLIVIGAFYVFAGVYATRAALISLFLDRALTAISGGKPKAVETAQSAWLLTAANIVLAGGAALMLRLDLAVWLFAASLAGQLLYLLVAAPRFFDVEDPPDPKHRRQTTIAAVVYAAATAIVAWAASRGLLVSWREVPWPLLVFAGMAATGHAAYTIWKTAT